MGMKCHSYVIGLIAAGLFAGSSLRIQAVDFKTTLDEIRELLKPMDSDTPETKQLKSSLQQVPDQWQQMMDQGQSTRNSEYGMQGMASSWAKIPGLSEKIQQLSKSMAEEAGRREAAKIAEAKAIISQVAETLKNAKKAEELDDLMLKLSKNQLPEYGSNPELKTASRDLQGAMQIVDNWQEYLIAEETGNYQSRRNQLEQIFSQLARTPILPRSIILRLLNQPAPKAPETVVTKSAPKRVLYEDIKKKLTESGDIATALAEILAIPEEPSGNSEESAFVRAVKMIDELRTLEPSMSESEVFANIRILENKLPQDRLVFNRAIDQIALNAIARNHGIGILSAKTTSVRNALESIATDAAANKNWSKLRKAINSLDSLGTGNYANDSHKRTNDLKILSLLELGETAEKRNDLEAAVNAYIEASLIDGQYLQRAAAFAKIADLKEKFPEQVTDLLTKVAEVRQRAEVARRTAEMELQERMMMNRRMPNERLQREDLAALRPMIQEVVAEFLKGQRMNERNASEKGKAEDEPKEAKKPHH